MGEEAGVKLAPKPSSGLCVQSFIKIIAGVWIPIGPPVTKRQTFDVFVANLFSRKVFYRKNMTIGKTCYKYIKQVQWLLPSGLFDV